MRVVVQRVERAEASLDGRPVAAIGRGLVVFVGFGKDDGEAVGRAIAAKVANLRVFEEGRSKVGRSLRDVGGAVMTVSQFSLAADTSRGRRPGFSRAAPPERARALYGAFVEALRAEGVREVVACPFQERLIVDVRNWGPLTLAIDGGAR